MYNSRDILCRMVLPPTVHVYTTAYLGNQDANAFLTKQQNLRKTSTLQGWSEAFHQHLLCLVDFAEYQIVPGQLEQRVVVTEC